MLTGFKAMADYLERHGRVSIHPDTLRKAVRDDRNPLRVTWDNGMATIEPRILLQWREQRIGMVRRNRRAA